jgi:hypothetical protein
MKHMDKLDTVEGKVVVMGSGNPAILRAAVLVV